MVTVELSGVHKVLSKGRYYYYAWRGGPRLTGKPGTDEFMTSYNEARESRNVPDSAKFSAIIQAYRKSAEYAKLADSTKRNWSRMLDKIETHFGEISNAQFDRYKRIRPIILQWRSQFAETPRTADYGMQVLSRVLSYGVDPLGKIASNPCEGIKSLYKNDRAAIIWSEADLATLKEAKDDRGKPACSKEMAFAIDLAIHTGLRVGDLIRLCWSHVGEDAIVIATNKSKGKREAFIPLHDNLRELLQRIPKRSKTILTNSRGLAWTQDGLASSFHTAKKHAGLNDRNLHFHDLRGTAATKFYTVGLPERVIAEIMGWSEDEVRGIIRRYVDRTAATRAMIAQINAGVKLPVKPDENPALEQVLSA
ncbi:tyrosine-type recombinase/integrase [Rhizobium lentis]|uniref:tyrosine-type recombinase/integrase n=1 Tax=Rhizobium lentis TaxID=1138194 RepID=UPI001C83C5E3|nr:tyrosine-type recombinase/integrase [Rhizobium lentis]MBX5084622.1 tyrosine-type recombinase/integrase [Rhizobium lentis]MBX5096779.1 tyrosine-type recombinase/integrase [Rhizobium lentis]MBX5121759.1 tyrosine-type recombinase/integrase [Rhizobium lentis]